MNDVRARGPPPSLELGILGSFLTLLNFRFYPSPGEIMLTTTPPSFLPPFPYPPFYVYIFLFLEVCKLLFSFEWVPLLSGVGGGGGGGVLAERYDGFCGVILMAYLVANVHGCKKHYKQFTNRIIILLKNKQKARNKRNVNKTKHYI